MPKKKRLKAKAKKKSIKGRKKSAKRTLKAKTKKRTSAKKRKVSAIPKGYNNITPYLIVNNALNAIAFYKTVFGAKVTMQMEKAEGKIGHAELKIGDTKIMLSDEHPEMDAKSPEAYGGSPVSIHLYTKDVDSVVNKATALGARLKRPVTNMFYGDRSATLEDPYGHQWHISTHVEDVSPSEMRKRMAEMA